MSNKNYGAQNQDDELQFKILSRSQQYKPNQDLLTRSLQGQNTAQAIASNFNNNNINDVDESDIFNDVLGGGVDPSIDESIRDSIRCSFVSSECEQSRQMDSNDTTRDNFVMNRMNWLTYLKVLFDQLESFNQNRQKHVESVNFIKALKKIKNLLPMQSRNDYYKVCSEVAFTYKEVEFGVVNMPKYITWDNVIDIFLTKQFTTQVSTPKISNAFQQIDAQDLSLPPQQIDDDSQISDVNYKDDEIEQSFQNRNRNSNSKYQSVQSAGGNPQQINNVNKKSKITNKNEDFFLSFADSVIKMTAPVNQSHNYEQPQQLLAQAPLLMEKDEDEACEIDSDNDNEESKSNSNSRRQKSKLEESIRSSRTATFKSIRNGANLQNQHNSSSFSNAQNPVQDSYYALQSAKKQQNSLTSQNLALQQQQQQQIYYQQNQQQQQLLITSKLESSYHSIDKEDGQVELGSNHSRASSRRRGAVGEYDEQMQIDKSTRISSMNSGQKNNINNSTILSQNSSHSSHSYQKNNVNNNSKISVISSGQQSSVVLANSNFLDLDYQGKNLKIELDFKQPIGDKKILRSINYSINSLVKIPLSLEKTLQYMNMSFNKLKSLNGIEHYYNLKFLNVQGNQITSVQGIKILQSLRELVISHNQLSIVKEIGELKNLNLLDISYNKIIDYEKLIPLQNLKKLSILSLQGNLVQKSPNYEPTIKKLLPWVQVLDPDQIRDFTQFSQMENQCFTDIPLIIQEQQSNPDLMVREVMSDPKEKERSKTPNKERTKSQLGVPQMNEKGGLKSTLISPKRSTLDSFLHQNKSIHNSGSSKGGQNSQSSQKNNKINQIQTHLNQQLKTYQNQYSENKFRLQGKGNVTVTKGNTTPRNNTKERSTQQDQKENEQSVNQQPQVRNRSISNVSITRAHQNNKPISQNPPIPQQQQKQKLSLPSSQKPLLTTQNTTPSQKEAMIKRVQLNMGKSNYGSQSRITPKRSAIQTPRQEKEKVTHYYKKSFCHTEDEQSLTQDTPSERNTITTVPTQDSSGKKQTLRKVSVNQVDQEVIFSPGQKVGLYQNMMSTIPVNSRNALQQRPVTSLKQRANTSQKEESKEYVLINHTQYIPQSTKNGNISQSFIFEQQKANISQQQITKDKNQKEPQSRPSSQLQKFITATSKNSSRLSAQTPVPSQACQKLTNLPPKSFPTRHENPGDKKHKADMSSSILSQSQQSVTGTSTTQHRVKNSFILQTGGTNEIEDDSRICESISSRSISPVCEEKNNIKKLKVDLTQYMNKQ